MECINIEGTFTYTYNFSSPIESCYYILIVVVNFYTFLNCLRCICEEKKVHICPKNISLTFISNYSVTFF